VGEQKLALVEQKLAVVEQKLAVVEQKLAEKWGKQKNSKMKN